MLQNQAMRASIWSMTHHQDITPARAEANICANIARILGEREAAGAKYSHRQLAADLRALDVDVDHTAIGRIVRGERRLRYDEAEAVAQLLGVPIEVLRLDVASAASRELRELMAEWREAGYRWEQAARGRIAAFEDVTNYLRAHPEAATAMAKTPGVIDDPDLSPKVADWLESLSHGLLGRDVDPWYLEHILRAALFGHDWPDAASVVVSGDERIDAAMRAQAELRAATQRELLEGWRHE